MTAQNEAIGVDNEIEALRAENAALKDRVAAAEAQPTTRSNGWRNGGAAVLMLLAALLVALAIPAIWVNRMVSSTDFYVQTVSPLARDTAIQNAVANAASDAAIERIDLQSRLESRLPTELAFLAAPINNAAEDFVRKQATSFVRSDAFPRVWDRVNEVSHKAFVAAVTGKQSGAVQVEAGTITLDLGVLADQLVERLSASGFTLVEKVPTDAINRTLTLYQSDTLAQATGLVDVIQRTALLLPLLGLALVGGAIALAADRRRVLLWLGFGLLVFTLLPLQAIYLGQGAVGARLNDIASIPTDAAQNAYGIIFSALIAAEQVFVAVSILIIVAALLTGPARWAVALRRGMSGGISGMSSHLNLGVFGEWVAARMRALRIAGYVIAAFLLIALPRPRTMTQLWWIVGFVVVWLLAVQILGSGSPPAEEPPIAAETEPLETIPAEEPLSESEPPVDEA